MPPRQRVPQPRVAPLARAAARARPPRRISRAAPSSIFSAREKASSPGARARASPRRPRRARRPRTGRARARVDARERGGGPRGRLPREERELWRTLLRAAQRAGGGPPARARSAPARAVAPQLGAVGVARRGVVRELGRAARAGAFPKRRGDARRSGSRRGGPRRAAPPRAPPARVGADLGERGERDFEAERRSRCRARAAAGGAREQRDNCSARLFGGMRARRRARASARASEPARGDNFERARDARARDPPGSANAHASGLRERERAGVIRGRGITHHPPCALRRCAWRRPAARIDSRRRPRRGASCA